jgi:hypothetical protein
MPRCETLIITQSSDVTAEVVMQQLRSEAHSIFRFNFDLFDHYKFSLSDTNFEITDPVARVVDLSNLKKAYFRKPGRSVKAVDNVWYSHEELWQSMRLLVFLLWRYKKLVLVEPYCDSTRLDKFAQSQAAAPFFEVPGNYFVYRRRHPVFDAGKPLVVKALVRDWSDGSLFTTKIEAPDHLDIENYGWFLQDYVLAPKDLTVVYVRGRLFCWSLDRTFLDDTVDWRAYRTPDGEVAKHWQFVEPNADFSDRVRAFMRAVQLDYGRLDFLWDGLKRFVFCEVNPNGQFAWLDLENKHGLIDAVATEISPATPVNPIPYFPFTYIEAP